MPTIANPTAPATDAQIGLIRRMAAEKIADHAKLDATITQLDAGLDKGTASAWITKLMEMLPLASDKQLVFIADLAQERLEDEALDAMLALIDSRTLTGTRTGTASATIDALMAMPKLKAQAATNLPEIRDGRYAIENADGVLTFYHIRTKRDGKVTIDIKAGPALHAVPFNAKGYATIIQSILDDGAKECSIRYGKELGCCGVCGRDLTSEWRKVGIGPICSQGF